LGGCSLNGSEVWVSLHVTPVRSVDRAVDVLFGPMVDITERRASLASLRAQVDEISWLGEIKRTFDEDRFELHAQPVVDLVSSEIRRTSSRPRGIRTRSLARGRRDDRRDLDPDGRDHLVRGGRPRFELDHSSAAAAALARLPHH